MVVSSADMNTSYHIRRKASPAISARRTVLTETVLTEDGCDLGAADGFRNATASSNLDDALSGDLLRLGDRSEVEIEGSPSLGVFDPAREFIRMLQSKIKQDDRFANLLPGAGCRSAGLTSACRQRPRLTKWSGLAAGGRLGPETNDVGHGSWSAGRRKKIVEGSTSRTKDPLRA
jgi:hypothetical protein